MEMSASLEAHFGTVPDPRIAAKSDHKLLDIVIIAICATIAGADGWSAIETFGQSKVDWLGQWLELPNGIPSHDTFERVFRKLDAQAFEVRFVDWTTDVFQHTQGQGCRH